VAPIPPAAANDDPISGVELVDHGIAAAGAGTYCQEIVAVGIEPDDCGHVTTAPTSRFGSGMEKEEEKKYADPFLHGHSFDFISDYLRFFLRVLYRVYTDRVEA
jgi:hypothetical protein